MEDRCEELEDSNEEAELIEENKDEPHHKKKNVKKNYIYNLIYHLFSLLTPLVVTPHITRVLGSYGNGQYAFTYSIISYFVIFASLGFGYYAQREIARHQNDKQEQTRLFYEIFIAKALSTIISIGIHIGVLLSGVYGETYSQLMWIMTINIVSVAFDISFIYQGNEDFGILVLITSFFKVIGVVLILVFVRNNSHLWLYTLCQSLILIVSNLSMWFVLPKYLTKIKINTLNVKRHILPSLRLFIPTVAVSVYTVLDKTLIGVFVPGTTVIDGVERNVSDVENGFYDNAEKLVKMAMMIITSLGTVMIPKNSSIISTGRLDEFKNNINKAIMFVFGLGMPIMFGFAAVALNFSPWFFGDGYEKVPYLIMMFCPLILIIGLSNVIGLQYLLPLKKDRKYTIAITIGAAFNLCLNVGLIPWLWSYGACISTILAEIAVTVIMLVFARSDIKIRKILKANWKYIVSGILMFGIVFGTQFFLESSIIHTILLVCEGVLAYCLLLLILRDRAFINAISMILRKLSRKK